MDNEIPQPLPEIPSLPTGITYTNCAIPAAKRGNVVIYTHWDTPGADPWFEITHADPHVLIADELLRAATEYPSSLFELDNISGTQQQPSYCGARLRITARNRTLIYLIGNYNHEYNAWEASWPD